MVTKLVLIVVSVVLFGACANLDSIIELRVYGKFCGLGVPTLKAKNKAQKIRELNSISERDDMDWACKQHDVCYVRLGQNNKICDELLLYILDHWALPKGCNSLGYDIKAYFFRAHWSSDTVIGKLSKPIIGLAPKLLLDHVTNIFDSPGDYPDVQNETCFFSAEKRHSYLETGRKFGGPFFWGRPLPKTRMEAHARYNTCAFSHKCDYAAGDLGLLYLFGHDGIRDERVAYRWLSRCSSSVFCREKMDMLEYKWKYLGVDKDEILRGAPIPNKKSSS